MANFGRLVLRNITQEYSYKTTCLKQINFRSQLQGNSLSTTSPKTEGATSSDALNISESCAKRLREIAKDGCLRIIVEGGGCSGFQYKFDIDATIKDDDIVYHKDGAKVVIDEMSLDYVRGSTIEYHEELIRSAFRIVNNPLAEQGCSCGASFSIKVD